MDLLEEYGKLIKEAPVPINEKYEIKWWNGQAMNFKPAYYKMNEMKNARQVLDSLGITHIYIAPSHTITEIYFTVDEPINDPQGVVSLKLDHQEFNSVTYLQHEKTCCHTSKATSELYAYTYCATI